MTRYSTAIVAIALTLMSCGGSDAPREITATRVVAAPAKTPGRDMDSAAEERAGMSRLPEYQWDTPPGWEPVAPTATRQANFVIGEGGAAQCYVAVLPGDAGGVEANVARWCIQMGQDPLDAAAVAALPRVDVLGRPAPLVEIAGDFTGMMGEAQTGALLLGLISERAGHVLFVKMIGPEAAVRAERDAFAAFCRSLRAVE